MTPATQGARCCPFVTIDVGQAFGVRNVIETRKKKAKRSGKKNRATAGNVAIFSARDFFTDFQTLPDLVVAGLVRENLRFLWFLLFKKMNRR